jgi:hypothetical protein
MFNHVGLEKYVSSYLVQTGHDHLITVDLWVNVHICHTETITEVFTCAYFVIVGKI